MSAPVPLTIVHVDAERGFSGGEVQVFLLMEGLRARGHRCVLFAPPESRAVALAGERGFEARPVSMRGDLDLPSIVRLRGALDAIAPDIVHLHTGRATWLGGLAARLAHRPAITTRRMDRTVRRTWRTRLVYGSLVSRVAAISPAVARCLADGGVDPARTVIVPSAIDPRRVEPVLGRAATRASLGAGASDVVLLALASLVPRKGLDVLLAALAGLARRPAHEDSGHEPHVWIAGDGPERDRLQRSIDELALGPRVRMLGQRADIGDLLAGCDVFVSPARREGLGVAALEAMAAHKPVIASRVGGLAEAVVDGRTGLLVEPDDPRALASAIERLCADAELRAQLGAAGPARVAEGFLPEQMVAAYENIYADVLAERAARSGAVHS